jgi:hypothetical protein
MLVHERLQPSLQIFRLLADFEVHSIRLCTDMGFPVVFRRFNLIAAANSRHRSVCCVI